MKSSRLVVLAGLWAALPVAAVLSASAASAAGEADERLAAARRLVERSDAYLHHSKLRRGMKGYGLTVLEGTTRVRFGVEIVSVMKKWGPHQDVILARLSRQDLDKTGVISGMSGSPCYIRHEGKDKLIGAVAYRFAIAQKEPMCGIQPITQMLAVAGRATGQAEKPKTRPATAPATRRADRGPAWDRFLAAVLDPTKRDFSRLAMPDYARRSSGGSGAGLRPLLTPLAISGAGERTLDVLRSALGPAGMMPVRVGGAAAADAARADRELVPGAAIAVPLVTGDADFSAVGTVTDVTDGRVLAFGHSFFADGQVAMPMGPAYVHTVISGVLESFKLSSTLGITGTLTRDETVGVVGRLGPGPAMIPMTVEVRWDDASGAKPQIQRYSYRLVRHRWLTPLFVGLLGGQAVWGWRNPPELHTVRHSVEIDFGPAGLYKAQNVTAGRDVTPAISDATRPVTAMLNNPLGPPAEIKRIALKMHIQRGVRYADILQLKLDGSIYRPGETVTGKVVIRPFRAKKRQLPIRFELPDDLPDGTYRLTACDSTAAVTALRREKPHQFDPKTVPELLEAIRRVVEPQATRLYLRLPLPRGGLAIGSRELPDLPGSKRAIIESAGKLDTRAFRSATVRSMATELVLSGSAEGRFRVQAEPTETLIRQIKE